MLVETDAYGGAETYLLDLARRLPPAVVPTLVAVEPVPAELPVHAARAGVALVSLPGVRHKLDRRGIARLVRAVRATEPDLVHVNVSSTANNRYGLVVANLLAPPAVATVHSWYPVPRLQALGLPLLYRRLQRVIAVSSPVGDALRRGLHLPVSTVTVVPNGVVGREPVTATARWPVRVGVLGRLSFLKGVDVLLQALPRVLRAGLDVEVVVAGTGPDEAMLRAAASGLPVRFLGFVDEPETFLASLDVLCLPSRSEGLPFSLLEAMACGLPIVASDVGAVREALAGAGRLVPPEDVDALAAALLEVAGSLDVRRQLGTAAHERAAACYGVDTMVASTRRVYDEAVAA